MPDGKVEAHANTYLYRGSYYSVRAQKMQRDYSNVTLNRHTNWALSNDHTFRIRALVLHVITFDAPWELIA